MQQLITYIIQQHKPEPAFLQNGNSSIDSSYFPRTTHMK